MKSQVSSISHMPLHVEQQGDDVLLWIKAVPGASRDQITGVIGDRLKVRISAAPEGGKANQAICKVIAAALEIKSNRVSIESGATNPEKTARITSMTADEMLAKINDAK